MRGTGSGEINNELLQNERVRAAARAEGSGREGAPEERARAIALQTFGNRVYIRGLIEISSYCKNNCYYCGLRAGNRRAQRYRLTREQILDCCRTGYALGFRTFVLQGGEDPGLGSNEASGAASSDTAGNAGSRPSGAASSVAAGVAGGRKIEPADDWVAGTVTAIKEEFPDCAVTLSLGERSEPVYRMWRAAGADRYLLRHETADEDHYRMLHPPELSFQRRRECLYTLKDLGYQVGAGFMVGSPGQTEETLKKDLEFLQKLQPHMIGIGPFVPHRDTPFGGEPAGTAEQTLEWISRLRIAFPKTLLPATTALGTIDPAGREKGILAGANVVMPNLSPADVRSKYELYDNKLCTGAEAAESLADLKARLQSIGYEIEVGRGDHPDCTAVEQQL